MPGLAPGQIGSHEAGNTQLGDRAQLDCATREGRAVVTANVADFIHLARDAVATNRRHAGIVLVPSSVRRDDFQAIADAIVQAVKPYGDALEGIVLYITRA